MKPFNVYQVHISVIHYGGHAGFPVVADLWSLGATPPKPKPPLIKETTKSTVKVEIYPDVMFYNGPITGFEIRLLTLGKRRNNSKDTKTVLCESDVFRAGHKPHKVLLDAQSTKQPSFHSVMKVSKNKAREKRGSFNVGNLKHSRHGSNRLPGTLWLELDPIVIRHSSTLVIGDGHTINGYPNTPLLPGTVYAVIFVVKSQVADTVRHSLSVSQTRAVTKNESKDKMLQIKSLSPSPKSPAGVEGLSIEAVVVIAVSMTLVVLFLILLGYFLVRKFLNWHVSSGPDKNINENNESQHSPDDTECHEETSYDEDNDDDDDDDESVLDGGDVEAQYDKKHSPTHQTLKSIEKYFSRIQQLAEPRSIAYDDNKGGDFSDSCANDVVDYITSASSNNNCNTMLCDNNLFLETNEQSDQGVFPEMSCVEADTHSKSYKSMCNESGSFKSFCLCSPDPDGVENLTSPRQCACEDECSDSSVCDVDIKNQKDDICFCHFEDETGVDVDEENICYYDGCDFVDMEVGHQSECFDCYDKSGSIESCDDIIKENDDLFLLYEKESIYGEHCAKKIE